MKEEQPKVSLRLSKVEYLIPLDLYTAISDGTIWPDWLSGACHKAKLRWDRIEKWIGSIREEITPAGIELTVVWKKNPEAEKLLANAKLLGCKWAKDLGYPGCEDTECDIDDLIS